MKNKANVFVTVLLICFILAGCGPSNQVGQTLDYTSNDADTKIYKINEPFIFEDLEITVLSYEEAKEYNGYETDNKYIIATVSIANKGKQPVTIAGSNFILIDADDQVYDNDPVRDVSFQNDNYFSITDKINPGLTKQGSVSFEVPESLNAFALGIRDNMFDVGGASYVYVILKTEQQ